MTWTSVAGLTGGALIILFALLRVERKRLWVVLLFAAPVVWAVVQWANFGHTWPETLLGVGIAGVIAGGWWAFYGRRLPAPTSDNIKVWGQESLPKPKPQELQQEVQRLREEKERLEAELLRLKGNGQISDEGRMAKDG